MFRVRVSQIFNPQVEDVVAAKKALDGGSAFTEAVAQYSTCPSKEAGGDLGWMPEENAEGLVGQAITQEDAGKIIGPIHSPYGYHLLMITDIQIDSPDGPFTADTPMRDVNQKLPEVHTLLFKKFHIGMPVSGYSEGETIASLANTHSKPVDSLLALLNKEFSDQNVAMIQPEELGLLLDAGGKSVTLLDIREQWERDIANIGGSVFVTRENCQDILSGLDKQQEIVLIDWKGDRAPSFQKWLAQQGFTQVRGIEGGIDAYADRVDLSIARYEIDEEDDDYRYQDIFEDVQE